MKCVECGDDLMLGGQVANASLGARSRCSSCHRPTAGACLKCNRVYHFGPLGLESDLVTCDGAVAYLLSEDPFKMRGETMADVCHDCEAGKHSTCADMHVEDLDGWIITHTCSCECRVVKEDDETPLWEMGSGEPDAE